MQDSGSELTFILATAKSHYNPLVRLDDEDKVINSFDLGQLTEASLMNQTVKNLLAMLETHIQSLGWEDTLENGMATHSSIPAWKIPWTEDTGRLLFTALQWDTTE